MTPNPRLLKKLTAAAVAIVGVVAAFHLLQPAQAVAISAAIGAIASIWEPSQP